MEYELPVPAGRAFARLDKVLERYLGSGYAVLGGGTSLAARWDHRDSTDIDLVWTRSSIKEELDTHREAILAELRAGGPHEGLTIKEGIMGGSLERTTKIDAHLGKPAHPRPEFPDRIAGSSITMETVAEILTGKIEGRMLSTRRYLARDLYDWAAAEEFTPDQARKAEGSVKQGMRAILANEIRDHWKGCVRTNTGLIGPVINPRWKPGLARNHGLLVEFAITRLSPDPKQEQEPARPRPRGPER